jgi:membrane fusion protein (multidrug efflux system)
MHQHTDFTRAPLALTFAASLAFILSACGNADSPLGAPGGGMPLPEVSVMTVSVKAQPVEMEFTGQTVGARETEVRARVAGIVQRRIYTEGAVVKAGQLLFELDPATFRNQLAGAEANVAVAQARVNQTQRDQARLAPLVAEAAVSQREFDDSKSNAESARAALLQATAQANEARLNLGYTHVTAPISGTTGVANKADGSVVGGSDTLLTTIVQTNPMLVNFSVPEADLLRMNKQLNAGQLIVPGKRAANGSLGFTVHVKMADGSLYSRTGHLNFASERVNPATGSFDMRAELPNPDGMLRPGQFVRVFLAGATRPESISVPQRAETGAAPRGTGRLDPGQLDRDQGPQGRGPRSGGRIHQGARSRHEGQAGALYGTHF